MIAILIAIAAGLSGNRTAWSFDQELDQIRVQVQGARQQQEQQARDRTEAAIRAEIQAADALEQELAGLKNQTQDLENRVLGPQAAVAAAAVRLSGALNNAVRSVLNNVNAVSRIYFQIAGGRDPALVELAQSLDDRGGRIWRASQDSQDQICLMVVDPLHQRKMYQEAQPLATTAPTLAIVGEQLSEQTFRLVNLVTGRSQNPRVDPSRHRKNPCDPSDIWPLRSYFKMTVVNSDLSG